MYTPLTTTQVYPAKCECCDMHNLKTKAPQRAARAIHSLVQSQGSTSELVQVESFQVEDGIQPV